MSSTGQPGQAVAASSEFTSSSGSYVRSILDALADYAKITGIDLSENRFAATTVQADSPEGILQLFQERVNTFTGREFRDGNQRLTSTLNPAVRVLREISRALSEAVSVSTYAIF